jgi:hypothetical protein
MQQTGQPARRAGFFKIGGEVTGNFVFGSRRALQLRQGIDKTEERGGETGVFDAAPDQRAGDALIKRRPTPLGVREKNSCDSAHLSFKSRIRRCPAVADLIRETHEATPYESFTIEVRESLIPA